MTNLPKQHAWLPGLWACLVVVILIGDYFTGPFVSLSVLFVVPVALASRFNGAKWGIAWGVLLPGAHFGLTFLWPPARPFVDSLINAGIQVGALSVFAALIDRTTRQSREIQVLRGLIPVCAFCKKIRAENQKWQPIEFYFTERSAVTFTSTFCPECAEKHYGQYYAKIRATQASNAGGSNPPVHATH